MELQCYGANCVSLTYKGVRLVVDDNLNDLGGKAVLRTDDIALFSGAQALPPDRSNYHQHQPLHPCTSDYTLAP